MVSDLWIAHKVERAAASATTYISTRPRHIRRSLRVDRIAAWNVTSIVATFLELGIKSGDEYIPLVNFAGNVAAGLIKSLDYPITIGPDQDIYAKFNDATGGDILHLVALGGYE